MPQWWNSLEALSRINTTAQIATGILLLLTAVAGFTMLMISTRLGDLRAETDRQLQERIRSAEAAQESLRKQLAASTVEAGTHPAPNPAASTLQGPSVPETTTAAKRHKRAREPVQPRGISPEQRRLFVTFMKDKPRGRIGLLTVTGDGEAHGFALEIETMLKEAGLETEGVAQAVFPREVPRGLVLRLRNKHMAPAHAGPIQLALEQIGFPAPGVPSSQEPANSVTLVIGRNPDT
jgi:hypothetical protein